MKKYVVKRIREKKGWDEKRLEKWLNDCFNEGLELVGVTNHNYNGYFIFVVK
jgi:hypothetical protein